MDQPLPASSADVSPTILAQAFDAAPNGFILISELGEIASVNQELSRMFGHPAEGLIGQSVDILLPEAFRAQHAEHRRQFLAAPSRRRMGEGRVLNGQHALGHVFPVEIGLTPLVTPAGARMVLASVVDMSDRHDLALAFQGLFDASPYGLMLVDDMGVIVQSNAALGTALGHPPDALRGQPLHRLVPERYHAQHTSLMQGYASAGGARMMGQGRDLTALHADGTEVAVEIGLNRVRWQGRAMTLAVVTDISARKRLEADLKQANTDLQEFSYVASHDLRSPLRSIADLVEWITQDLADGKPEEVGRNLARITPRIQRMESLIDDLLRYARAGKTDTDYRPVSLPALVTEITELQPVPERFMLDTSGLDARSFQAVRTPLSTVLRNLLDNAVKHHDRDTGRIQVAAHPDGNHMLITVTDDGPGVPPQASRRIFQLFQTLSSSRRAETSGIGLALCKRMTETHGGHIDVVSPVAQGRGAQFRVWWPMYPRRTNDE
ncbi:MAG: PAS domain-containing sensor histidine kinase [Gammaproteobacteria bacterium]|nr:PAS domain-containing sensor histidine kinase [Gammaproteobacteria bacterium]